jgi:hypothetical protein
VFILYAVVIGVVAGFLLGGRLGNLARLQVRWAPLAIAALGLQLVLFTEAGGRLAGDLAPVLYVASTGLVLAVVLVNLRIPGLVLVAAGAACNLAAIVANGGWMPADPDALASLGRGISDDYTNSTVVADPALRLLTDMFAMPSWMPLANVFSVGDVLIGLGIAVAIAVSMRRLPAAADGASAARSVT